MMEFWPENQGQYAKFGTVPGRNCTHNYHDRHQAPHYPPVYYGEQQDQGRESSYWTLPGSRTGGALQEYTNWTEPELTSSHFPFILDRHTQQHQDLGEYQAQEARDREWTAAQRATREYERGFLREGWQRKWEPCSPVRYNREVSKRTDSSYRELEAWAARYSHSLPRRRRIEAELRGASQGLLERSRDSRSGTDRRATMLQQVMQSANIRESGLWDRGVRQQAPTYYPPQVPAPETSHVLDIKENTGYQRRMFSQPPGYIAPPPYNSPLKGSPVTHHCDISWEQEGKRQTYWSQATLRKQGMYDKNREKEDSQKPEGNQKTFSELEGLKHQRQETVAVQPGGPISIQHRQIQHECQPQTIQAVQNTKIKEETSSKVIEGRKFRLNKKTGGLTIFCLVSRIAGTSETPSLPICTPQTIIQSTELGGQVPTDLRDINQTLADEIDFRAQTLTEQSNTQASGASNLKDTRQMETSTCVESETLVVNLSNEDQIDVSPDSTFAKQVALSVAPMSVKYPLWRQPSFTSKVNSEEEASDDVHNPEDCAEDNNHPTDVEVTRLDIKKDIESEDSTSLLVIDTTCVVKMEVIQSPKKEQVYFLDSTAHTELGPLDTESTSQNQDVAIEQKFAFAETKFLQMKESPETELDLDLVDKTQLEVASEISFPCLPSSPETLEERAERILGISLHNYHTQQQSEEATSLLELHVEGQDERVESSQMKNNDVNDEGDTKEREQPQNLLELDQNEDAVRLRKDDDVKDLVTNEGGEDFTVSKEETNVDSQSRTDTNSVQEVEMIEDSLLESSSEEEASEQVQEKIKPVEINASSQDPSQCLSPSTDFSNISSPSPSLDCKEPIPALALRLPSSDITSLTCISESTTEEGPDPELTALDSAANLAPQPETLSLPQTPSQQLPSPLPPGSTEPSPCSTPHTDNFPPPPVDLILPSAEAISTTNLYVEDQVEDEQKSELMENEISDVPEDFAKDIIEDLVSQQQFEYSQSKEGACIKDSDMTEETLQKDVQEDSIEFLEQTPEICEENVTDSQTEIEAKILQQRFDYGRAEDAFCEKETEEQSQKEENKDLTDLLEQRPEISEENATGSQTEIEAKILQQQFDYGRAGDAFCEKETEEQKDDDVDPVGLLEETISKEDATDCQAQREVLQDIAPLTEPSDSDCEVSQMSLDDFSQSQLSSLQHTSHESNAEFVSLLEMASVCPSTLNPDTGVAEITETVLPPLLLVSCDESLQFSSPCPSESVQVLPPSSSTPPPPEKESGNISPDLPIKEECQYPKSLWDAVNRIRKHTAPDSENEEEEVSELWDPESVGEDSEDVTSYCSNNTTGEKEVFDEAGHQEVSEEGHVEDTEVGQVEQDQCHEEPTGHAEDDTLSCSSTSSHDSGDTVIEADEDEAEEISDVVTESKTETDGEFPMTEGEQCCSDEIQETAPEEDGDGHETECYQIEECPGEVKNITIEAVEIMEAEQKQKN